MTEFVQPPLVDLAWRIAQGLLFCIATFVFLISLYKRFSQQPSRSDSLLEILEQKTIGHKMILLIVRYQQQKLLLVQDNTGVRFLTELKDFSPSTIPTSALPEDSSTMRMAHGA